MVGQTPPHDRRVISNLQHLPRKPVDRLTRPSALSIAADAHWSGDTQDRKDLRRAGTAAREALPPLERIELALHPWVTLVVLPLFALANAGFAVSLERMDWTVNTTIVAGLCIGKPLGIVSFSYLSTRIRTGNCPDDLSWPLIAGGALLTSIGFIMALLMAELALEPARPDSAKLGIVLASLLSAAAGLIALTALTALTSQRWHRAGAERVRGSWIRTCHCPRSP